MLQLGFPDVHRAHALVPMNHSIACGADGSEFVRAVTSNALSFHSHLIQNGGKPDAPEEEDPVKRYIRNSRDLSRTVVTDTINT